MKRPSISLLILVFCAITFLVACSSGGSAPGKMNCSNGGEVCIYLKTVQSVAMRSPIQLQITVKSSKDISDLHLRLFTGGEIILDGPQTWEKNITSPKVDSGVAFGDFSIKASETLTFTRVLHFPSHQGSFHVVVEVFNNGRIIEAVDGFYLVLTQDGGQAIFAGTPFPAYTPNVTDSAYGPGTPAPPKNINPTYPPIRTFSPLLATSTSQTTPYPPPSSPYPTSPPYP